MADNISRILKLAGLTAINEDCSEVNQPEHTSSDAKNKRGMWKGVPRPGEARRDHADIMDDELGLNEDDIMVGGDDEVTVSMSRNLADWLQHHLENCDEPEASEVCDAVCAALGDGCGDDSDFDGEG